MITKHTPTPWKTDTNGNIFYGGSSADCKHSEYGAASHDVGIEKHSIFQTYGTKAEANAAFIVTAVNAHEDLVKALQKAETYLSKMQRMGQLYADGILANAKVKEALIKAGVKS